MVNSQFQVLGKDQKLPVDDVLARMGISIVSNWSCCSQPQQETLEHIFLTGDYAAAVWKVFTDAAGIQGPFVQGWYKCNSDGASKGNPGPSSAGFCVRDSLGDFIYATTRRVGDISCLVAEAKAMYDGLVYGVTNQLLPLYVESDSLSLVKMVEGTLCFANFMELPAAAKRMVNIDKMQMPSFRFKPVFAREPD
ncbi:uncharacterized protein LOC132039055 [Lycium ferocissimum]|uniref:uncharacterized protein LOC132039055 n=1 Tax=Lycium ferocissimum TaxID=112874 RepID=UPI002814C4C1|nr:uncharacterized protein LOC132039055 [Lycium ferocissimum]